MKAFGIPCALCRATIQVQRASKSKPWLCVSSTQCLRRQLDMGMTPPLQDVDSGAVLGQPAERRCKCGHLEGRHFGPLPSVNGSACAEECSCKGFVTAKIPARRILKVDTETNTNAAFEWVRYENPLLDALNRADAKLEASITKASYKAAIQAASDKAAGKVRTGRTRTAPRTSLVRTALPGCVHRGIRLGGIK